MEAIEREILDKTHYGLKIYAHVLSHYFPEQTVLTLSGKHCQPASNPFRKNRCSLQIVQNGYTFEHIDLEDSSFTGNAFDFAALHYGLKDETLIEKIKTELHVRLKDRPHLKEEEPKPVEIPKPKLQVPTFSFFKRPVKNTVPYKEVSLVQIFEYIKSDYASQRTTVLREKKEPKQAREYKACHFDYVTFSGLFSKRSDKDLLKHSGLLCLDFDHLTDKDSLKQRLLKDEYFETEILFVSPSGDGLKWIVSIEIAKHTHANYFAGLAGYIKQTYGLQIDPSGKDVSRACFLPHDPEVFINTKYLKQ